MNLKERKEIIKKINDEEKEKLQKISNELKEMRSILTGEPLPDITVEEAIKRLDKHYLLEL